MTPKVSVIVPALDEERNLAGAVENVVRSLHALRIPGEVIIVDDGSTDGTARVAAALVKKHPNVI